MTGVGFRCVGLGLFVVVVVVCDPGFSKCLLKTQKLFVDKNTII